MPATYFGVDEDEYVAYCFNQVVTYVGKFIENKMEEASAKAKNSKSAESAKQRILNRYLAMDGKPKKVSQASSYMDPAAMIL